MIKRLLLVWILILNVSHFSYTDDKTKKVEFTNYQWDMDLSEAKKRIKMVKQHQDYPKDKDAVPTLFFG